LTRDRVLFRIPPRIRSAVSEMSDRSKQPSEPVDRLDGEPPPFLGTWPRLYAAVLVYSAALILALYWITRTFNR